MRGPLAALGLVAMFAACTSPPSAPETPPVTTPSFPLERYTQALQRGDAVYRIDPEQSEIVVRAYRGGALARLGHDHIVASRAARGYVAVASAFASARADVHLDVGTFEIDEPARRAAAGLDTQPSASDIEGTRANMRKTLDVDRFPFVALQVDGAEGELPQLRLKVRLTLHGVTRSFPVDANVSLSAVDLTARGKFAIAQSEFGMTPFAVLGGALQVQDRLDVDFQLSATRAAAGRTLPSL